MMMIFTACNNKPEVKELSFDPLLEWGCSLADVEAHIKAKPWYKDGNDSLDYWDFYEGWHKWYWVSEEYRLTEQYLFETQNGQNMFGAMCFCWNKEINIELAQSVIGNSVKVRFNSSKAPVSDMLSYTLGKINVSDISVKDADIEEIIRRLYEQGVTP